MHTPDFSVCQRVLSSRWMLPILQLADVPRRFGDIQAAFDGLSRGVLSEQLRELMAMELLDQNKYTCFPPKVEYRISHRGRRFLEILDRLVPEQTSD